MCVYAKHQRRNKLTNECPGATNSNRTSRLLFPNAHEIHFSDVFSPWQQTGKIKLGSQMFFFVLLSAKRLSFHSRSHYPSTTEVLRWQPVDWQLIGSRLREPTIAGEWSRRPALSSFSSLSHFTRQPQDVGCVDACHRSSAGSFLLYFDQWQNLFCIFQPCLGSKWFDCQLCVVFVLGWVFSFRVIFTNISRNG